MQDLCKMKLCYLALFVLLIKVCHATTEEPTPCEPGFSEQRYAFTVTRKILERGRVLGKVSFNTCSAGTLALYAADDTRFRVFPDGKVTVKRPITLHDGSVSFVLNAWDAARKKHSVTVFVWNEREQQETSHLLRRQKRDRTFPPVHLSENERGTFPKRLVQISSSKSNTNENIKYAISGKGADMPPIGVFTINAKTGFIMVSGPLDREKIDRYQLEVRVLSEAGENLDAPMTILIHVADQNDNRPVFTQSVFEGSVAEGSPPGTSVLTVSATDPDDTIETNNGILRYSILQQSPKEPSNAFSIADDTGVITVNAEGLSQQQSSKYTLTVKVADQEGHGFETTTKVIITIGKAESTEMSGSNPSLLTTHILNVAQGVPAKGVTVTLSKLDTRDGKWNQLSRSLTNEDGRCPSLLRGEPLTAGTYQMRFDTGQYWTQLGKESFYPYVEVVFTITDPSQKYHVPLLISPYSYSTYRGS